jgi:hypothetical protein
MAGFRMQTRASLVPRTHAPRLLGRVRRQVRQDVNCRGGLAVWRRLTRWFRERSMVSVLLVHIHTILLV